MIASWRHAMRRADGRRHRKNPIENRCYKKELIRERDSRMQGRSSRSWSCRLDIPNRRHRPGLLQRPRVDDERGETVVVDGQIRDRKKRALLIVKRRRRRSAGPELQGRQCPRLAVRRRALCRRALQRFPLSTRSWNRCLKFQASRVGVRQAWKASSIGREKGGSDAVRTGTAPLLHQRKAGHFEAAPTCIAEMNFLNTKR
jgi:hypothetical protein